MNSFNTINRFSSAQKVWLSFLLIHAAAVLALLGLVVIAMWQHDPAGGANIGAGLVLLAAMALGLLWILHAAAFATVYAVRRRQESKALASTGRPAQA